MTTSQPITLVDADGLAAVVAHARQRNVPIASLGSPVASKSELIEAIAVGIGAPAGTGRNWDALADMLSEWPGVLCLADLRLLSETDRETLQRVVANAQETNSVLVVTAPS